MFIQIYLYIFLNLQKHEYILIKKNYLQKINVWAHFEKKINLQKLNA